MSNRKGTNLNILKNGPQYFFQTVNDYLTCSIHRIANKET